MRQIGLHIRFLGSFSEVASRAIELEIPLFQCFLVLKSTGTLVVFDDADVRRFNELRSQYFGNLYVHGSYWINLASAQHTTHRALLREVSLARRLGFTHIVIHPGSANGGGGTRQEGIAVLAQTLNRLFRQDLGIQFVLENAAHGALSVGGDLTDFALLLSKLEQPHKLLFCIDTAHAYAYGYDISDDVQRSLFIDLLEATIGIDNIALIHLNDTHEACGSKIDKHAIIGSGRIGEDALKAFCLHEKLAHIPLIMELPVVPPEEEVAMLVKVRGWHE